MFSMMLPRYLSEYVRNPAARDGDNKTHRMQSETGDYKECVMVVSTIGGYDDNYAQPIDYRCTEYTYRLTVGVFA